MTPEAQFMKRARAIPLWSSALALAAVLWATLGAPIGVGTATWLIGLSLVPPALFMLWPGVQPATVGDVNRRTGRG